MLAWIFDECREGQILRIVNFMPRQLSAGYLTYARVLEVTSCPAVPAACCMVYHKYCTILNNS